MTTLPQWIDYRQLPTSAAGFSSLFLDYIYNNAAVQQYFPLSFRDGSGYESVMAAIDAHGVDRATLSQVLHEQNVSLGAGQRAIENAALLSKPDTYAVVTGQQVSLFGGPLYTAFKTLTAIKLAQKLRQKYPGREFVPVFWLEGEDHDFEEMNRTTVLDHDNTIVPIEYQVGGVPPERNLGPIGELVFDSWIEDSITRMGQALQKTEFSEPLLAALRSAYQPGRTFNQAFVSWMAYLFGDSGLVFISGNHPKLKKIVSPIFVRELSEFPAVSQLVISESAELEKQYHAQIKTKSINLFLFHKGGRYLIEPRENDFSLKGTRHFLTKDELIKIAVDTPELLSPNVVMRPIVQDTLLPTVAYVAGPSEIAYQAQLRPVYEHFKTVQPVIYPRASGSVIEERVVRVLEKFDLDILDLFRDREKLVSSIVEQISEVKVEAMFASAEQQFISSLSELRFGISEVDATLLGSLDTTSAKIRQQLVTLREKTSAAQRRQHETAIRQLDKAINALIPNGSLQEREISLVYFMNKFGPDIPGWLMKTMEIDAFKHQLLIR